jgi:hypothetical protein
VPALTDATLGIPAGQAIAVIGRSGQESRRVAYQLPARRDLPGNLDWADRCSALPGLLPFNAGAEDADIERLDRDRAVGQSDLHLRAAARASRITDDQR